jgi:hypothetical protein
VVRWSAGGWGTERMSWAMARVGRRRVVKRVARIMGFNDE